MKRRTCCAVLILLAGGVSVAAGQSSSPTAETLQVDGEPVQIFRDRYGVPRVFAKTLHGLFVANGYAVAEDRAWQMEKYRLDAAGRLAEVFGEKSLDRDKQVRRDGMTREEWRDEFDHLPAEAQEIFRAYVEGANRYLEDAERAHKLSEEFSKRQWKPAPWTVEDSMAIGGMMGRRFGASGTDHLRNVAVVEYLTKRLGSEEAALQVFNDLAWIDDPAAIPTVESGVRSLGSGVALQPADGAERTRGWPSWAASPGFARLFELDDEVNSEAVFATAHELGLPTRWGSYAWLLSPARSASASALLVGGPQMGFATPQIAHQVQLTGAGVNVMGMGFAGIPGVLIGMNDHLAWTSTSGASHNEDVYLEKLNPSDPHEYWFRGAWHKMEHRVERILIKDRPAVLYDVYRTVHGPIIQWSPDRKSATSKRMAYFAKEYETAAAFLGLNTAKRIQDIPALAAQIASSHNIFVATEDGDVGFWHCGFFPVYPPGVDPRFPLRGTGEDEWQGFIPFDHLPQVVNPPSGIIFNWNNKPSADWKRYSVPAWGVAFHISNIRNALERRLKEQGGKLSLTDAEGIAPIIGRQNYIADWLKPGLVEAASRADATLSPEARQALDYLRHWDNWVADGSVAQTIFDAWYNRLRDLIFAEAIGNLGDQRTFDRFVSASTVAHALAGAQSSVRLSRNYLGGRRGEEVELTALDQALAKLRKERGPDMTHWGYSVEWIKFDPLPSIPWYSRGTYIQAVELSRPRVHGVYILPPGESEDAHSPHYGDQLWLASWWMFAPMELLTAGQAP